MDSLIALGIRRINPHTLKSLTRVLALPAPYLSDSALIAVSLPEIQTRAMATTIQ